MTYEPSSYWKELNNDCFNYLDKYGYENFKRTVGVVYNDFFVADNGSMVEDYGDRVKEIWDRMYEVYPEKILDLFEEPLLGNPNHIIYRGRPVTVDLALSMSEICLLIDKIDFRTINVINEIGGGYGRLAQVIMKLYPHITYKMYDIEPSLIIARMYLTTLFPNNKLEFHSPEKMIEPCDLLIACNCLHEMTKEQVDSYFSYANRLSHYFYYSCWKTTEIQKHGIKWRMEDYPVGKLWEPLFVGDHRTRKNYFEALYKI